MSSDASEVQALKQVVIAALEQRGILAKVKADVRASVFTIIQEQQRRRDSLPVEPKAKSDIAKDADNKLSCEVFIDFLEHHGFAHTLAVFMAEIDMQTHAIPSREKVANALNLPSSKDPIIKQLIGNTRNGKQASVPASSTSKSPALASTAPPAPSSTENAQPHSARVNPLLNKLPSKSPTHSPTGTEAKALDTKNTSDFQKPKPLLAPLSVKGIEATSPKKELSPISGISTSNKPLDFLNRRPLESVRSPSNHSPSGSRSLTASPHSTVSVDHSQIDEDEDEDSVEEDIESELKSRESKKEDGYSTDEFNAISETSFRDKPDYEEDVVL